MSTGRLGAGDTAIQPTILDAKGDLIVATAADTPARLAVGSANQVLTVDSSTATGLKWAAAAAGGKVLQVVQGTTTTEASNSTTTYADTNLTASITPSAASSKVLIFVVQNACYKSNGNANNAIRLRLMRDATELIHLNDHFYTGTTLTFYGGNSMTYLDTPNTTSAITYKTQFSNFTAAAEVTVQRGNSTTSTIILMEIGA